MKLVANLKLGDRIKGYGEITELRMWSSCTGYKIFFWDLPYVDGEPAYLSLSHESTVEIEPESSSDVCGMWEALRALQEYAW